MDVTDGADASDHPAPGAAPPIGWVRLAGLLTATMVAGTIGQFTLGALGPLLIEDLSLSRVEFGAIQSSYFLVAAVLSPLLGPLTDRLGGRRMLLAMLGWQAAVLIAMAMSPTYALLVVAAGLGGGGAAASNPITNRLIMVTGHTDRRGLLVGMKQSGPWLGAVISGSVLAPVAAAWGWRTSFLVAAAAVAALAIPARTGFRPTGRRRMERARRDLPGAIRRLVPYAFLMGVGGAGLSGYLALFAHESLGMSEAQAGFALAALGVSAVLGRIGWGRATERRDDPRIPLRLVSGVAIPAQLLLTASALTASVWVFWVSVVVLGLTAVSWNTVAMVAVTQETAVDDTGRASGVVLTGFYVGLLVGPVLTGALIDASGGYVVPWAVIAVSFLAASAVASVSPQGTVERRPR